MQNNNRNEGFIMSKRKKEEDINPKKVFNMFVIVLCFVAICVSIYRIEKIIG